ncbi:MazG-like family protein [Bacillus cereus]|uniref:NTP pyrophosphohydrolase MazG putative catalytic core domain-containing protein n=1 Tax=Bacillus cereus TIAC219 TaxID=718222 RepID=A0ABC9SUN6_BACCE|nr:MazG-like family protein [Bacillus cereus]EJP85981.1 hypothetical protein IC1_04399 [Bacillus cereus VD022]EOQ59755.1 hypothetical protein IAY_03926 [Bacillus cereus TIAC219]PFR04432.1 hypothetical protein COK31_11230 [Bacillus cereus]
MFASLFPSGRSGIFQLYSLADVLIYLMLLANDLGLDVKEIMKNKIEKNKNKYPVEKAFGVKYMIYRYIEGDRNG